MEQTHIDNLANNVDDAVSWYENKRPDYESLSEKVKSILIEVLDSKKIDYNTIQARAKGIESFKNKLLKYMKIGTADPKDIQDLAGIRVIVYVSSDIEKVSDIVKQLFPTDQQRIEDKSQTLGVDRVGYRSNHFVAILPKERIDLIEYKKFEGLLFEIQIRSILQHAWAEINHDRNYKFSGILPEKIKRRFNLLSGTLEIVDNEFERISMDIEEYSRDVSIRTKSGRLDIPINSTSVIQYLTEKFGNVPRMRYEVRPEVIEELHSMKINTLADLDRIIPANMKEIFIRMLKKYEQLELKFTALIRIVLAVHDIDGYYRNAWKEHFLEVDEIYVDFLGEFGIEADKVKKYIKVANR